MNTRFLLAISLFFLSFSCIGLAGEPMRLGENSKGFVKISKKVAPAYPADAKKKHITGKVVLDVTVNEQGKVSATKTKESADPSLENAAIDAVKQWEFEPLKMDGKPTAFITTITLNFALDKDKETPNTAK
ncbi:MAG TPA: energy transducer TonB [Terriglobia bacterium]|nr:energy transducer TonB [Terriglobia bacterium]